MPEAKEDFVRIVSVKLIDKGAQAMLETRGGYRDVIIPRVLVVRAAVIAKIIPAKSTLESLAAAVIGQSLVGNPWRSICKHILEPKTAQLLQFPWRIVTDSHGIVVSIAKPSRVNEDRLGLASEFTTLSSALYKSHRIRRVCTPEDGIDICIYSSPGKYSAGYLCKIMDWHIMVPPLNSIIRKVPQEVARLLSDWEVTHLHEVLKYLRETRISCSYIRDLVVYLNGFCKIKPRLPAWDNALGARTWALAQYPGHSRLATASSDAYNIYFKDGTMSFSVGVDGTESWDRFSAWWDTIVGSNILADHITRFDLGAPRVGQAGISYPVTIYGRSGESRSIVGFPEWTARLLTCAGYAPSLMEILLARSAIVEAKSRPSVRDKVIVDSAALISAIYGGAQETDGFELVPSRNLPDGTMEHIVMYRNAESKNLAVL